MEIACFPHGLALRCEFTSPERDYTAFTLICWHFHNVSGAAPIFARVIIYNALFMIIKTGFGAKMVTCY